MGFLLLFLLILLAIGSVVLFFNKGETASEIKTLLQEVYENLKSLFKSLKKLILLFKNVFIDTTDEKDFTEELSEKTLEADITSSPKDQGEIEETSLKESISDESPKETLQENVENICELKENSSEPIQEKVENISQPEGNSSEPIQEKVENISQPEEKYKFPTSQLNTSTQSSSINEDNEVDSIKLN